MTLPRGATIGILGEGQLGRMLAQAAQKRGYRVHGYGHDPNSPLGQVTPFFTAASFDDTSALAQFRQACAVVTSEFENVPLRALEITGCVPQVSIFALAQDRLYEKQTAQALSMATAPFYPIENIDDLKVALAKIGQQGV